MNALKSFALLSLFFGLSFLVFSCGEDNSAEDPADRSQESLQVEAPHGEGAQYTSAYVCPMHCEGSGSEEPGKCPACGMDYVALEEHTQSGHTH
jgi:hypothetical protein